MTSLLDDLAALGVLSPVDVHFARLLGHLSPSEPPEVLLGAALASRAVQRGHVCADLDALSHRPLVDDRDAEAPAVTLPDPSALRAALAKSPLVATSVDREHPRPLVLARNKLYLHRYAAYEAALAECLRRSALVRETVNADALRNGLDRLFGSAADEQRRAALVTVLSRLSIVSGGPGTGKTYTVSRILALLQTLAKAAGRPFLRVLLLAPTGKAAQRVAESIERSVADLDCDDDVRAAIPRKAATIHRALGHRPNTPTRYRHDAENPLPVDVVIVDEASMIDVALMAKLVLAVPPEARLVLLGDKDQLASVEAGAILGDIYGGDAHAGYSEAMRTLALRTSGDVLPAGTERDFGLGDCLVHLTKSRRFGMDSDVGALARAIQAGDAGAALSVLSRGGSVRLHPLDAARNLEPMLGELVLEHYGTMREHGPEGRLALLSRFRILCAHRRGAFGVDAVNTFVERHLEAHGRLRLGSEWYDGRPVMIAANDYQLSLWNGDVAVIANTGEGGGVEAHFEAEEGHAFRKLPPSRLPAHETVFAMTVHKSQGSQFSRVALVLPEKASPILTRELVYTAVSRAEAGVDVFADESVFAAAIARTVERSSGLREALWGPLVTS